MAHLALGCRVALFLIFAAAVLGKLRAYPPYAASMRSMRLPAPAAPLLLGAEATVVVLLAWRYGVEAAAALLLVLTAGVAVMLRRETAAACLCFGRTATPLGPRHLVRNVLLLLLAVGGAVADRAGGPLVPAGVLLALAAATVAALLIVTADDLADLFRPLPKSGVTP